MMAGVSCPWCRAMITDLRTNYSRSLQVYGCGTVYEHSYHGAWSAQRSLACRLADCDPDAPPRPPLRPPAPPSAPEADEPATKPSIDRRAP